MARRSAKNVCLWELSRKDLESRVTVPLIKKSEETKAIPHGGYSKRNS